VWADYFIESHLSITLALHFFIFLEVIPILHWGSIRFSPTIFSPSENLLSHTVYQELAVHWEGG
jgi:hypothetical protein